MSATPTMTRESTPYIELGNLSRLDPVDQFKAIDVYVRDFDKKMREWPTLAKMVIEVRDRELWKFGGFPNYSAWIESAAPTCSATVFQNVTLYEKLKDDFTDDDLDGVPKETAKKAVELSTGARKNPKVKQALKKDRAEFVKTVQAEEPDQHMVDDVRKTLTWSQDEWDDIEFVFHAYQEQEGDDSISIEKAVFEILHEWRERKGL